MVLNILQIGDKRLLKKSKKVIDFADKTLQKLIEDMIDTCEKDVDSTAGLAAPQIGENLNLAIVRRVDIEEKVENQAEKRESRGLWEVFINPEIIEADKEHESVLWEACLSIGVKVSQLWGPVWRPDKVKVKYQDRQGKTQTLEATGFFSHLIQHEIDHLNGVLFISRVRNPEQNLWRAIDFDKYIDENGRYPKEV